MEIEYKCKKIRRLIEGKSGISGLPTEIEENLRKKLAFLKACKDERDIRNAKSFHYEKLNGRNGLQSIRINDKWRLIVNLENTDAPPTIVVYGVEDYH